MAFLTVLALAGTFVILIGGIDLSVAATATLAGILIATWIDKFGGPLAIVMVIAAGAVVGLVNGLITTMLKVPSFLVTLGMMSVLDGISNTVSKGGPVSYNSNLLQSLVNESMIPNVPNGALIAILLTIGATVLAFGTSFGRHMYAVGGNERAAALVGVRVRTHQTCGLRGCRSRRRDCRNHLHRPGQHRRPRWVQAPACSIPSQPWWWAAPHCPVASAAHIERSSVHS